MQDVPPNLIGRLPSDRLPLGEQPPREKVTWWDQQQAKNRATLNRVIFVGLGAVLLWGLLSYFGNIARNVSSVLEHKGPSLGATTSWSPQLSTAQKEAAKIDSDAILYEVSASPLEFRPKGWNYTKTLEVEFEFITPAG